MFLNFLDLVFFCKIRICHSGLCWDGGIPDCAPALAAILGNKYLFQTRGLRGKTLDSLLSGT